MKTAISIPNNVFESAEKLAALLGSSRSQLYTKAVEKYIDDHNKSSVTDKLNKVYASHGSDLDKNLAKLQSQSIFKENW